MSRSFEAKIWQGLLTLITIWPYYLFMKCFRNAEFQLQTFWSASRPKSIGTRNCDFGVKIFGFGSKKFKFRGKSKSVKPRKLTLRQCPPRFYRITFPPQIWTFSLQNQIFEGQNWNFQAELTSCSALLRQRRSLRMTCRRAWTKGTGHGNIPLDDRCPHTLVISGRLAHPIFSPHLANPY